MREARRSKGMTAQDVYALRINEFLAWLIGTTTSIVLTQVSGWFALGILISTVVYVWWARTLMRVAELCIDDDGILERGVFFNRRRAWADTSERTRPPARRPERRAVVIGHCRIRRRYREPAPVLVVCCAGDPYPRPIRAARSGAMSNVLATLGELAEAGYPVEYNTQSPRIWAADPRSGLTPRDGRWPWRLRHLLRR